MAVTHKMYGPFYENLMKANIPSLIAAGTTIKVALMYDDGGGEPVAFSFDQNHDNWADVMAYECTDADYVDEGGAGAGVGGQEILLKAVTYALRVTTFDTTSDPKKITFTASGNITATHAVIYLDEALDADSKLISCIDFGGERESVEGEFSITWDASGIFKVTVAE